MTVRSEGRGCRGYEGDADGALGRFGNKSSLMRPAVNTSSAMGLMGDLLLPGRQVECVLAYARYRMALGL